MRWTSGRTFYPLACASAGALASSADAQTSAAGSTGAGSLPPVTIAVLLSQLKKRAQRTQRLQNLQNARRAQTQAVLSLSQQPAIPGLSAALVATPGRGDVSSAVTSLPAETTVIDAATISRVPYASYDDLFRPVTGFDISTYGQGVIGYGLSLRGYTDRYRSSELMRARLTLPNWTGHIRNGTPHF